MSKDRNIVKTALAETMFFYKRSFVPLAFDTVLKTLLVSLVIFALFELLTGIPALHRLTQIRLETFFLVGFTAVLTVVLLLLKKNARFKNAASDSNISLTIYQKIVLFASTCISFILSSIASVYAAIHFYSVAELQFCRMLPRNSCFPDAMGNLNCTFIAPSWECDQEPVVFFQVVLFLCLLFLLHLTQVLKIIIRQTFHQKNTLSRLTLKQSDL